MPRSRACLIGAIASAIAAARPASAGEPSPSSPPLASSSASEVAGPLPSRDTRWSAALGAAVDVGTLPRPSPGLALGVDVRRGGLGARASVAGFRPQTESASGASVGLFDIMAMICALAPLGSRLDAGACLGGGVGLLRGVPPPTEEAGRLVALRVQGLAGARLDVALVPKTMFLSLEPGAVVDPFRTSPIPDRYRSSLFSFRGAIALVLRVW